MLNKFSGVAPKFAVWIIILSTAIVGCIKRGDSDLGIDNGIYLRPGDANVVDGVVNISASMPGQTSSASCTATIVSTDTVITAAHCVYLEMSPGNSSSRVMVDKVCTNNAVYRNVCTTKIHIMPDYQRDDGMDLAVLVFEGAPFKHIFTIKPDEVKIGDPAVLVGYSSADLVGQETPSGSVKRWGKTKVDELEGINSVQQRIDPITRNLLDVGTIISAQGGPELVRVNSGDSGGPMFIGCKIAGVASRKAWDNQAQQGSPYSMHTNLTRSEKRDFLSGVGGATICSDDTIGTEKCPAEFIYAAVPNLAAEDDKTFPCAIGGVSGEGKNDIRLFTQIDSKDANVLDVYVATSAKAPVIAVCPNITPDECTSESNNFRLGRAVGTGRSNRTIYKIGVSPRTNKPLQLSTTQYVSVVVRDADGKLIHSRIFDLVK